MSMGALRAVAEYVPKVEQLTSKRATLDGELASMVEQLKNTDAGLEGRGGLKEKREG
jgi:hypothetical protein